jgi:hypothetical protein
VVEGGKSNGPVWGIVSFQGTGMGVALTSPLGWANGCWPFGPTVIEFGSPFAYLA